MKPFKNQTNPHITRILKKMKNKIGIVGLLVLKFPMAFKVAIHLELYN